MIGLLVPVVMEAQTIDLNKRYDFYDVYRPKHYSPMEYSPQTVAGRENIKQYCLPAVSSNMETLEKFLSLVDNNPGSDSLLYVSYGDYHAFYEKLLKKKVKRDESLDKKKQMRHFEEDFREVDYYLFKRDSVNLMYQINMGIQDSLSYRAKFVSDSVRSRESFIKDSINYRNEFVEDSLYRDDFRKKNNYDYVEFASSYGPPVLCYRNGKIVDGKIVKNGLLLKEYKNGKLIHDYDYSKKYIEKHSNSGAWVMKDDAYVFDKIKNIRTYYDGLGLGNYNISKIDYFNKDGSVFKTEEYTGGKLSKSSVFKYYPDKKTKQEEEIYDTKVGELYVFSYYSDGALKQANTYRKDINSNSFIIKRVVIVKDGYNIINYYDYNGRIERTETKYRTISDSDYGSLLFLLGL